MQPPEIRAITDDDWPIVFEIFDAVVAAGDTYAWPEDLTSGEAKALWVGKPPWHCVVAVRDATIVGTAKYGPNRPARGSHIANASFMVAPSLQGGGVGRALCEYVIRAATDEGFRGMQFNAVVSTNVGAIALYESLGFTTIGTVPGAFNHRDLGYVGLDIMYREL